MLPHQILYNSLFPEPTGVFTGWYSGNSGSDGGVLSWWREWCEGEPFRNCEFSLPQTSKWQTQTCWRIYHCVRRVSNHVCTFIDSCPKYFGFFYPACSPDFISLWMGFLFLFSHQCFKEISTPLAHRQKEETLLPAALNTDIHLGGIEKDGPIQRAGNLEVQRSPAQRCVLEYYTSCFK